MAELDLICLWQRGGRTEPLLHHGLVSRPMPVGKAELVDFSPLLQACYLLDNRHAALTPHLFLRVHVCSAYAHGSTETFSPVCVYVVVFVYLHEQVCRCQESRSGVNFRCCLP